MAESKTDKKEKMKKLKLRSKKNQLLLYAGRSLDAIWSNLIELNKNITKKQEPILTFKKFDFKMIEPNKFEFDIKTTDGMVMQGTGSFWICMTMFNSLRYTKEAEKKDGF